MVDTGLPDNAISDLRKNGRREGGRARFADGWVIVVVGGLIVGGGWEGKGKNEGLEVQKGGLGKVGMVRGEKV